MVASGTECSSAQNTLAFAEDDDSEDFIVTDANRVLFDANQMLIDLKNEIDKKNATIQSNDALVEELKVEVARTTADIETIKQSFKEELFEKDKLVKLAMGYCEYNIWSWYYFVDNRSGELDKKP